MEKGVYNPERAFIKDLETFFSGREASWKWQAGLFQQIKDLGPDEALWKSSEERHCIWEIVRHVNYWKSYVIAKINNQEVPNPETGSWPVIKFGEKENDWQDEIHRTELLHNTYVKTVNNNLKILFEIEEGYGALLRQLIYHDAYHAGQIGILRVMQGLKPIE